MTDNELEKEILKIILITYSIICLVLLVVVYILIFRRKNFSDMEIFSLQLSLAPLLNAISYLLPADLCKIQAVTHVFSVFCVFSLYFIYYLNNYLLFSNSSLLNSKKTKIRMYILNWLFILILALINYSNNDVEHNESKFLCRYPTDNLITIINIIYLVLMLLLGIILLYLIAKKIKKTVKANMNFEKNLYKNVINIFIMIVFIFTLNVLGFFLKLKKIGGERLIYEFIDRTLECIGFLLVTVFLIGRNGFSELKQMFTCKKEQDYNTMNVLNTINDDEQIEIDF